MTSNNGSVEYFGAESSARIMGLEMSAAYVGSAAMPALFGVIGRSISMKLFFPYYVLLFLILNIAALATKKRRTRKKL